MTIPKVSIPEVTISNAKSDRFRMFKSLKDSAKLKSERSVPKVSMPKVTELVS